MEIKKEAWGGEKGGETTWKYTLKNAAGNYIAVCNYGAALLEVGIADREGRIRDVVLGYDTPEQYRQGTDFFGACVGRFGGWIKDGIICAGGQEYQLLRTDGKNHLHGGARGFDKRLWEGEIQGNKVVFRLFSPDGEEGYPGNMDISVSYEFTEENALTLTYDAVCDSDTVCNLTNHSYFNLDGAGSGSVYGHTLLLNADWVNDDDEDGISCLGIRPVEGTVFDFRKPEQIGARAKDNSEQLLYGHGYDHNFYLGPEQKDVLKRAAVLSGSQSGIVMEVWTNQSGVQLYAGNYLKDSRGKGGRRYGPNGGVCLETQFCASPEEVEKGHLYPVLCKNQAYHHKTTYRFVTKEGLTGGENDR